MAISVKDIQEKEFSTVTENGYSMEQVDDFLDELAEQWGELLRDNLALAEQVKQLQESLDAAQAANAEMEKKLPDYNEKSYFKNLETAMRETLIGAQRIADEAVSDAQRKAKQTVDDANAFAEKTTAEANAAAEQTTAEASAKAEKTVAEAEAQAKEITEAAQRAVEQLSAESERLKGTIADYKSKLKSLIDEHLAALG